MDVHSSDNISKNEDCYTRILLSMFLMNTTGEKEMMHRYRPIARDVTGRARWSALEDSWSRLLWGNCT